MSILNVRLEVAKGTVEPLVVFYVLEQSPDLMGKSLLLQHALVSSDAHPQLLSGGYHIYVYLRGENVDKDDEVSRIPISSFDCADPIFEIRKALSEFCYDFSCTLVINGETIKGTQIRDDDTEAFW